LQYLFLITMMLGQKIKKLRELKNYTQEHMAKQLSLTQSGYCKIELDEVDIPYSRLEQVAKVLGLKPEDIISFNEQMVFNVMHNKTESGVNGVVFQNQLPSNEKKLYEEQIQILRQENTYLKGILDKVLTDK